MAEYGEFLEKVKPLVHQCAIIETDKINFSNDVRSVCESNACGQYNKSWVCPPAIGEVEDLKKKCLTYSDALVFTTCGKLTDSFDIEGMEVQRSKHDKTQKKVRELLNFDDNLLLGVGGCRLCKTCNYPDPCRFPDSIIPSLESYGINVVDLAKKTGLNYHNGENTVTYFSIVFFNKTKI